MKSALCASLSAIIYTTYNKKGSSGIWSDRSVNCSLSWRLFLLVYGRAFTKTDKTPYCGQNHSGFNKRYGVWSYESELSTPIRHTFYWSSKLHLAHNRAINIKNIRQATTNNIEYSNSLRASGCFLCLSPYIFSEWHIVPLLYI